jgi:hypothetical protein
MAITYTYLVPDSDFTADSLNLRFDAAVGTNKGINALTLEDLCLGALRHNHLPRLVLQDGIADATTYADLTGLGSGSRNIFSTMNHTAFSSTLTVTSAVVGTPIVDVSYNALPASISLELGMDTDSQVGAILVLANADLTQIDVTATDNTGTDVWKANEDEHYGLFYIKITDSSSPPNSQVLHRTVRAMSPRVTISTKGASGGAGTTYHFPGFYNSATGNDKMTNQDVSIRTVIMPSDLDAGGLSDVARIELMAQVGLGPTGDWTATLEIGKSNLTAIPLHTKLNQL